MDICNLILSIISIAISGVSLIIGIIALRNTSLIKQQQAHEIEVARDIAIFESDMPRAAIIEKPNQAGTGILFLRLYSYEDLINYLNEHPGERVITSQYNGKGPYNKVEVAILLSENKKM